MNTQQVFQMVNGSTASGRGTSYWEVSANCGERRYLSDIHKDLVEKATENEEAKRKGVYFHQLMDFWLKGQIPDNLVVDSGPVQNAEFSAALRLFRFLTGTYNRDFWGKYVGSEIRMPMDEQHKAKIEEFFGHSEVTGAIDALYILSDADVHRLRSIFTDTADALCAGVWIVDWKTTAARASAVKAEGAYKSSMQAKLYPTLLNLAGLQRCEGMIHVVLTDHTELRARDESPKKLSSIQLFVTAHNEERALQARAAVNFARAQRDSRTKNAYACVNYTGQSCPFYQTLCSGY